MTLLHLWGAICCAFALLWVGYFAGWRAGRKLTREDVSQAGAGFLAEFKRPDGAGEL